MSAEVSAILSMGRWVEFHSKGHQIMSYPGAKLITGTMHGTLFHEMDHKMKLLQQNHWYPPQRGRFPFKPNKMTEMFQNIFHNYAMIGQDVTMRIVVNTSLGQIFISISTNTNHWNVRLRFLLTMSWQWLPLCLLAYPMLVTPKPREWGLGVYWCLYALPSLN